MQRGEWLLIDHNLSNHHKIELFLDIYSSHISRLYIRIYSMLLLLVNLV